MDAIARGREISEKIGRLPARSAFLMALLLLERLTALSRIHLTGDVGALVGTALRHCWDAFDGREVGSDSIEPLIAGLNASLPIDTGGVLNDDPGATVSLYTMLALLQLLDACHGEQDPRDALRAIHSWLNSYLVNTFAAATAVISDGVTVARNAGANAGYVAEAAVEDLELVETTEEPLDVSTLRRRAVELGAALAALGERWEESSGKFSARGDS